MVGENRQEKDGGYTPELFVEFSRQNVALR